jgi:exodeoxyribonuclease V gamma subunit
LALPEVRALLADRLRGRATRASFRTGHLTVCTLVPMRSVPHRVVCLLGLDDGVFPRKTPRDGDDLLLDDPHIGERDARTEDRQLLLDAVLAATDHLIVTYTGNDERTNVRRPPAVPVGELLDVIDRTVRTADDRAAREIVRTRHPLQPFDPRNFTGGKLGRAEPWSFDKVTLEGGRALIAERHDLPPFLAGPLPPVRSEIVEVEQLVRFVEHPVRAFLRQRLGVGVGDFNDDLEDALPVELDGLGQWGVGDRLLAACLSGTRIDAAVAAERARGTLPPGGLANAVVDKVRPLVERIAELAGDGEPTSIDVKVKLSDGRMLAGTVPRVTGDVLRTVIFSRVGAKHRLAAWVQLLALTAAHPGRSFSARTIGRAPQGSGVTLCEVPPLEAGVAKEHLQAIIDVYDRGMREPLPLAVKTSGAYAEAVLTGGDGLTVGAKQWNSEWSFDKEDKDLEHQLVHGGVVSFAELVAIAPVDGEDFEADEASRFGRFALRLWRGLCEHEQVRQL